MAGALCRLLWPLLLVLVLPAAAGPRYSSRIVDTQSGAIRGIILEPHSRHLEPVEAFLGVPYGAASRLQPPHAPPPWHGTRLADSFGPVCPQRYPDVSNRTAALLRMPKGRYQQLKRMVPLLTNQSEDCLFLNIYVPGSGNRGVEAPYAVLVWVHGDSYEWGSGNPYDGSVLASHGHVIVLTLNFRLGLLGFLKTRPGTRPGSSGGNLALRDLCAALRWAKHNLESFGGDPSRLTLLGHAHGAALANLLLLMNEARGLFHRLVLLSGSALSPWALVHDPDSLRSSVAEQLGCNIEIEAKGSTPEYEDITTCLQDKPLEALLDVRIADASFIPRWGPFHPIEQDKPDPVYAMEVASDSFITCSLILGVTTTESYYDFSASDIQYGFEEDYRNRVLRTFVRNAFVYHLNEIYAAVRNEYTDWEKPIQHPINIRDSTMEALSDGHTAAPLLRVAALHARRGATTYLLHFQYQSKDGEYPQRLGSVRGEQIPYALGLPLVSGLPYFPTNYSRQDGAVSEALVSLLVTFAKTGDPNTRPGDPAPPQYADYGRESTRYKGVPWEPYVPSSQRYLSFGLKPKMKSHYRGHKMALWLNLIPQLHKPGASDVSMRHHHFRERDPHFYTGPVRPESFTQIYGHRQGAARRPVPTECQPTAEDLALGGEGGSEEDEAEDEAEGGDDREPPLRQAGATQAEREAELLMKLANKHYYSYTAALGITVGIGCFLLVLNMIIFAGIYYQRGRGRQAGAEAGAGVGATRSRAGCSSPPPSSASNASDTSIHLRDRPSENTLLSTTPTQEPPPLYRSKVPPNQNQINAGDGTGTLRPQKKRVQIQEISV